MQIMDMLNACDNSFTDLSVAIDELHAKLDPVSLRAPQPANGLAEEDQCAMSPMAERLLTLTHRVKSVTATVIRLSGEVEL